MRRLAMLAVAVGLLGGAGATTATASTDQVDTQGCSTWQYRVDAETYVIETDGADVVAIAYPGNKFNTNHPEGVKYFHGRLYRHNGEYRVTGWVRKADLEYTKCW